jgi:hypothetical protein
VSLASGHQAIISRIVAETSGTNIVLPNGPGKSLPRYVVMEAGGSQRPFGLDGRTEAFPEVVVRVETLADKYATQANTLCGDLVAMFPPGLLFSGMQVVRAPDIRPPLPVLDGVYSVPVVIQVRFVF